MWTFFWHIWCWSPISINHASTTANFFFNLSQSNYPWFQSSTCSIFANLYKTIDIQMSLYILSKWIEFPFLSKIWFLRCIQIVHYINLWQNLFFVTFINSEWIFSPKKPIYYFSTSLIRHICVLCVCVYVKRSWQTRKKTALNFV